MTETDSGSNDDSGQITNPTENTSISYTITFCSNGGDGGTSPTDITAKSGEEVTLPACTFTRTGYDFKGWCRFTDGTGTIYEAGEKVKDLNEGNGDVTLFAKWVLAGNWSISYVLNGDTLNPAQNSSENPTEYNIETEKVTLYAPERRFYEFAGWYDNADFSDYEWDGWNAGVVTGDVKLYAKWTVTCNSISAAIEAGATEIKLAGKISEDEIGAIGTAIRENSNTKLTVDLGGTTGLTEIPEDFMSNQDENLLGLVIPASVTEIKSNFWFCSNLSVLKVAENNPAYKSIGNIIYTKDGQTLVLAARALTEATIPANVVTIGTGAFQTCEKLQKVTFEQGSLLETIEKSAFGDCLELANISFPASLKSLGKTAFTNCRALTSVALPEGINTIFTGTFTNCMSLTEISLPSTLETIETWTFGNTKLSIVKYNGTKDDWKNIQKGNYNDDLDNAALICLGSDPKKVYTPADKAAAAIATLEGGTKANRNICTVKITSREESDKDFLKEIGENIESRYAEYVCINLDLSATSITEIPEKAFYGVSLLEITLPDSLYTIRMKAFKDDYKLKKIVIPDNVRIIEAEAFNGCLYLAEITLPASLTNIGEYAFDDCVSLKTIKYGGTQDDWSKIELGEGAFTSGTKITCSDGNVVTIE